MLYVFICECFVCIYICIYIHENTIYSVCECMCLSAYVYLPMCDIWGEHHVAELLLKEKEKVTWTGRNRCTRVLTFYLNVKKM